MAQNISQGFLEKSTTLSYSSEASAGPPHLNMTGFFESLDEVHSPHAKSVAGYAIILACSTTVLNTLICVVILGTRELRSQPLYLCVFNFSIVNVLIGVLVTPIAVYLELTPYWNLGDVVCKLWIFLDVLFPFTSMVILTLLTVDRLIYTLSNCAYSRIKFRFQKSLYLVLPWMIGISIVCAIWIGGFKPMSFPEVCLFALVDEASVLSPLMLFFIPATLLIVMMTFTLGWNIKNNSDENVPPTRSASTRSAPSFYSEGFYAYEQNYSMVTLYFMNFLYLILWFPFHMMNILLAFCDSCMPPYSVIVGSTWLGATSSFVVPLLWFTDYHIRYSMRHLACKVIRRKESHNADGASFNLIEM